MKKLIDIELQLDYNKSEFKAKKIYYLRFIIKAN